MSFHGSRASHYASTMVAVRDMAPGSRSPQGTPILELVRAHLIDYLDHRVRRRRPVPDFVAEDLTRFVACGDIACGHATMYCPSCGFDHDIPFSCKRRGFCPWCLTRRMAESAQFIEDNVIGDTPIRHWIGCLPPPLRNKVGNNPKLASDILRVHIDAIFDLLRRQAAKVRDLDGAMVWPGSVTFIHRASANLAANFHFHILATDGVFVWISPDSPAEFIAVPQPTAAEIEDVAWQICVGVCRVLERHGMWSGLPRRDADPERLIRGKVTIKSRSQAVAFFAVASDTEGDRPVKRRGAVAFDLCGDQHVRRGDRKKLRRLLRYVLAPPITNSQIQVLPDGLISFTFKRPRRDGQMERTFSIFKFLDALVQLAPRPNVNLVRFHGAYAPNFKRRDQVVPYVPPKPESLPPADAEAALDRFAWAMLMQRTYAVDIMRCPRCMGRLQLIYLKCDQLIYRRARGDPSPDQETVPDSIAA